MRKLTLSNQAIINEVATIHEHLLKIKNPITKLLRHLSHYDMK